MSFKLRLHVDFKNAWLEKNFCLGAAHRGKTLHILTIEKQMDYLFIASRNHCVLL